MFSGDGGVTGQNILRDLASVQEVNIPDVIRREATRSTENFIKDAAVRDILRNLDNQLDPQKHTNTRLLLQNSIDNELSHTHPDYFPRKNAGERAILEK